MKPPESVPVFVLTEMRKNNKIPKMYIESFLDRLIYLETKYFKSEAEIDSLKERIRTLSSAIRIVEGEK